MKKFFKIFVILTLLFVFAGCEMNGGTSESSTFKGIKFTDQTFEYDGEAKSIFVEGLPEDATVEYLGNEQTEPGSHTVKATVTIGTEKKTFSAKIIIDDSHLFKSITFSDATFTYDGTTKSLSVEGLPASFKVTYEGNDQVNAGKYKVKASVTSAAGTKKDYQAYLIIEKAMPKLIVEDGQAMYLASDGKISGSYELDNTEQTVSYKFLGGLQGAGEYDVLFTVNESANYLGYEKQVHVNFYLNEYELAFAEANFIYDGEEKEALLANVPAGLTVEYVNNKHAEQGRYHVSAKVYEEEELLCTVTGLMVIDCAKNEEFEQYMDEFLVAMFEGDQMSINFFFVNPENYGLEHYEADLPTYSAMSQDDMQEAEEEFAEMFADLANFKTQNLSFEEQITLTIVEDYLNYLYAITPNMNYMTNSYLGSYLGYQSNLPLDLAEYKFRNEQDIIDFIGYLNAAPEAFKSYYQFCLDQVEHGYGLSDVAIDNVISQCEKFVAEKANHYLIDIFNDKIDNIDFELVEKTAAEYKQLAKQGIQGPLCDAYDYVAKHMGALKGADIEVGGLSTYGEEGLEYYRLDLGHTLGIPDINLNEAIKYIDNELYKYNVQIDAVVARYRNLSAREGNAFYNAVATDDAPVFTRLSYDQLLASYQDLAKQFVPDIDEMPEITIKYVYESLQDNFSPAAYFVSPLDETRYESIYLNGKYTDDVNYIFTTLAHEGYPGHLYQNVYAKQLDIPTVRKALRCQGYMEGWATYMELNSYQWVTTYTSEGLKLALEYLSLNDIVNGLLSCRVDLGIHAQGWTAADIANYMTKTFGGDYEEEKMVDFYNQIVEIPTNMSMYFYSWSILMNLHDKAKKALGSFFDEVGFNKVILDCGAAPLHVVTDACNQYIADMTFLYFGE